MKPRSLLSRLCFSYVALIGAWLVLRALIFDRFWLLALIHTAVEYLFLPLPAFLLTSLWMRRWRLVLGLALPVIAFVAFYGELFWPAPVVDPPDRRVTFMSFNLFHRNTDYEAIGTAIRAAQPDVIGLQEARRHAESIAGMLEADYPYHTLLSFDPIRPVALLSRYPIESAETFPLPPLHLSLHAVVQIDGRRVHVFVVHLSANSCAECTLAELPQLIAERNARRVAEVAQLEEEIRDLKEPVIMLCDCNMTSTSETYLHLDVLLDDSFREAGWGFGHTLHVGGFSRRFDYVWHSGDFVAIHAAPGQDGGSDHRPIVAELALQPD